MTSNSKPTLLVGADPELFLINREGKFISSINKIGGSKAVPRDIGEGCAVQEDNVAVEFNIPPAKDADEFVKSIDYALKQLTEMAKAKGLNLSVTASKKFDNDQLQHFRAKIFGCDPDFNAWNGQENSRPNPKETNFRTCGGHVHLGLDDSLDKVQVIRWCDVRLGLNSVLEDEDTERRSLYGQAGAYRDKPYGVEYRTLSNYWLKDEAMMRKIFSRAEEAVAAAAIRRLDEEDGELIQVAINRSDKDLAETLLLKYS